MIMTTTPTVEGRPTADYLGLVVGEAILGANIVRDETVGNGSMLMVTVSGTAVRLGP